MISFPRKLVLAAALVALVAIALTACCRAQQTAQPSPAAELAQVPLPEPAVEALPAAGRPRRSRPGAVAQAPRHHRQRADDRGSSRRRRWRAADLSLARPGRARHAVHAHPRRGRPERHVGRELRCAGPDPHQRAAQGRRILRRAASSGAPRWTSASRKRRKNPLRKWGHDRVLYDAVLAVRRVRPQVIVSTFVGGVSDGHGQHQVSGEIAQEAFKAAGDPKVFPEQLKNGLEPWQPLAVYSRDSVCAALRTASMFDYATGKSAPARFHNYVTGEWIDGEIPTDVTIPVGRWDPVLGRSYVQIAREGWGKQKSQNGGANPALSGPDRSRYHLWAVRASGQAKAARARARRAFSTTARSTSIPARLSRRGLRRQASGLARATICAEIEAGLTQFDCRLPERPAASRARTSWRRFTAHTLDLCARVQTPAISTPKPRPDCSSNSTQKSSSSRRFEGFARAGSGCLPHQRVRRLRRRSAATRPTKPPPVFLRAKSSAFAFNIRATSGVASTRTWFESLSAANGSRANAVAAPAVTPVSDAS